MNQTIKVTLGPKELHAAKLIALAKNESPRQRGHKLYVPTAGDIWQIMGIEGERAASVILVLPRANREFSPNLGGFIEVRTRQKECHGLPFRPEKDKPEHAYVLMLAHQRPTYSYVGWAWGFEIEAKGKLIRQGHTKSNGITAYYLERGQLRSVWSLFHEIDRRNLKREVNEIKSKAGVAV